MCQPPGDGVGVCDHCLGRGTVIQIWTNQCSRRSGHRGHVQSHKWTHLRQSLALFAAGLPEHGFPTSDTQHNRMNPRSIAAAGMARSAAIQVDSSGIEDDRDLGPGCLTGLVEGRDVRPRRDHQRGLVVETAPNVVGVTAVDLSNSPHDSVVDALELDLAVDEEFDGEEREQVVLNGNGLPASPSNMHDEVPSTVVANHVPSLLSTILSSSTALREVHPNQHGRHSVLLDRLIRNQSFCGSHNS